MGGANLISNGFLSDCWGGVLRLARNVLRVTRRLLYSTLGFIANLFLRSNAAVNPFVDEQRPLERIAVIGRGKSAELFTGVSRKKTFSAVVLCNFQNRDLASADFRNAIRQVPLIVLLANPSEPAPSFRMAKFLGINCVMVVRRDGDLARKRTVWRLNRLGLPVQPLPESLPTQLSDKAETTGIAGVAIGSMLSHRVEVFGIEFYRTDYIVGNFEKIAQETGEAVTLRLASDLFQQSFERVAAHQASTLFTLHCYGDHSISAPNVAILRTPLKD